MSDKSHEKIGRRDFVKFLGGMAAGASLGAAGAYMALPTRMTEPVGSPKRAAMAIPEKPIRMGLQTAFKGPAAIQTESIYKGAVIAIEEINAEGGILGKRKIELIARDEGGTDETVKEYRRLVLQDSIDVFVGIFSSGNAPAVGPVAEELGVLTIFVDGCTDFLFEKAIPRPHFVFRHTNIQSADGVTCALGAVHFNPELRKKDRVSLAHINPDFAYGRNAFDHFNVAFRKLVPGEVEIVYEAWPKLFTTDFTPFITRVLEKGPDIVASSLWGGDYITFYKQALPTGLYDKVRFAGTITHGMDPGALGRDHPENTIAGVHANYYFTYPPFETSPLNRHFVEAYYRRWGQYPNFEGEGAYTSVHAYRIAVEKASALVGGWPEVDDVIRTMEGLAVAGPAGYVRYREDNHQGYKNAVTGISKNSPQYGFSTVADILHIPIEKITAPPGWKGEPTAAYAWIEKTWAKARY